MDKKLKIKFLKPKILNHYESSPYNIDEDIPINYSINKSIDFGYGIKRLINQIKRNEKDTNF